MAFFEDLGKKITQTGQGVVQKTKDTAEVIKLNGMISDEEKRISEIIGQIGKKYFELYGSSPGEEFKNFVAEILDSQKKISEYSEQVKKLKGIIRCPNCGGEIPYGSPFCNICGSRVDSASGQAVPDNSNVRRCGECGTPIADGFSFCTHCGTKYEDAVDPATTRVCPNCNTPADGESVFCMNCGSRI